MSKGLNILTTVAYRIYCILKTKCEFKSCNKFNSFLECVNLKKRLGGDRMKLSIFSSKTETLLEFLSLCSKLFHSVIADRKKEFWKSYVFVLIRGVLPTAVVACGALLTGMRLKRHFGCSFWILYKRDKVICTHE